MRVVAFLMAATVRLSRTRRTFSPQADDPWQFEERRAGRDLAAARRSQAVDIGLFAAFAALALTSFFRKSVPLKYVTLVAAVAYLGIYKSQLLSIVNIFGVMGGNLPIFKYNLGWYVFALFSVVTTVLWGRLYCGRVCAYGALTQLLDPIVPARFRYDVPLRIERQAQRSNTESSAPWSLYFLVTRDMSIYRYVEPFWMFTGHDTIGCGLRSACCSSRRCSCEISTAGSCVRSARRWGCSRR